MCYVYESKLVIFGLTFTVKSSKITRIVGGFFIYDLNRTFTNCKKSIRKTIACAKNETGIGVFPLLIVSMYVNFICGPRHPVLFLTWPLDWEES